jgi:hypothetical protein
MRKLRRASDIKPPAPNPEATPILSTLRKLPIVKILICFCCAYTILIAIILLFLIATQD